MATPCVTSMELGGRFRFTRQQWYAMAVLGNVKFALGISISLQWPLFPSEAEKKGSTATEYGLILGIFSFGSLISCPIFGKYINRIGAKKMLNCGLLLAGISVVGLGLLDLIDSHVPFVAMAFIMRFLHSLGSSAANISAYSITVIIFYDAIATSFAITESFKALGFSIGPILGGYLFEVGDYMLPFVAAGGLFIMLAVMVFFLFPDIEDNRNLNHTHVTLGSVLVLLPVLLLMYSRATAAMGIGFITTLLEPHLREFHLNPVTMGTIFMIDAGVFTFLAPLVGYLCDTIFYAKKVIIFGGVMLLVGTSLIGPAPFLPMETTLWGACVGLMFSGIGQTCLIVPTFIDAIHSAVALGMPNDMALYGVVSGLSQSAYALGDALGPSMAGILKDTVGYRNGTIFLLALQAILVIAMSLYVYGERRGGKRPLFIQTARSYESIPTL